MILGGMKRNLEDYLERFITLNPLCRPEAALERSAIRYARGRNNRLLLDAHAEESELLISAFPLRAFRTWGTSIWDEGARNIAAETTRVSLASLSRVTLESSFSLRRSAFQTQIQRGRRPLRPSDRQKFQGYGSRLFGHISATSAPAPGGVPPHSS